MTYKIPQGFTTITPSLMVEGAKEAVELYKSALGATLDGEIMTCPQTGKVMHACLTVGNNKLFLADVMPACGGASQSSFCIYTEDADKAFAQATKAGMVVRMPVTEMFWGDKMGTVTDKFGISWSFATHVRDVSPAELEKGAREFAEQMGNGKPQAA